MKSVFLTLFITILFLTGSIQAQKYSATTNEKVVTTYNNLQFTSEKTLLENLSQGESFSRFASLLENQGESIFSEDFMGTVFVMTDSGFSIDKDGDGEQDVLLADAEKNLLKFLIVPGRLDAHGIRKAIENGNGKASLATLNGEKLGVRMAGDRIFLLDSQGNTAEIVATDFYHKHGFFHIISSVIMPTMDQ